MSSIDQLPWTDSNDTLSSFMASMPKDVHNLIGGQSTYGFHGYVCFLDTNFYDMWLTCGDTWGLGLGLGLMASSLLTRLVFVPSMIYAVSYCAQLTLMFSKRVA